jgi:lysozyme
MNQVAPCETAVNRHVKVVLNQGHFDALCSLAYNIGVNAFVGSTLLKLLNEGEYGRAAAQFGRWNKSRVNGELVEHKGLTERRKLERRLFEAGEYA